MEEEKARILTSNAFNSITSGAGKGNADSETIMRIKQISVYSNELVKEKQRLNNELKEAKDEITELNNKLGEF